MGKPEWCGRLKRVRPDRAPLFCFASGDGMVQENGSMGKMIVRVIVVGLMLLSGCANAMDIICPPAGQCPNVRPFHGGGY